MTTFHPRTDDPTLSVTKAAQVLGVHPNTVRAWSDQGRLRYYRINARGDRRFRIADLNRFLSAAERDGLPEISEAGVGTEPDGHRRCECARTPHRPTDRGACRLVRRSAGLNGAGFARCPAGAGAARSPAARSSPGGRQVRAGERGSQVEPVMGPSHRSGRRPSVIGPSPVAARTPASDVALLAELAELATATLDLDRLLGLVVRRVRVAQELDAVEVWEWRGEDFGNRASDRSAAGRTTWATSETLRQQARSAGRARVESAGVARSRFEAAIPIPIDDATWGVLPVARVTGDDSDADLDLLTAIAAQLGTAIRSAATVNAVNLQLRRTETLRRVAGDISADLGLDEALRRLVDHAMVLFGADRGAAFLPGPDAQAICNVSRGLSERYLRAVMAQPRSTLPAEAIEARRPIFAMNFRDDPRAAAIRPAIVQEGYDTVCAAPMVVGEELIGVLTLYHDRREAWSTADLDAFSVFATQAATLVQSARQFGQLASWAAHLQSIQQLGTRLSHLGAVDAICNTIATELREVIAHDNIRVYLVRGEELVPVALQGLTPVYAGETAQELTLRVGQGITGWVAAEGVGQNLPDAENDPRGSRIAGTDPMDESMLLAPMTFESRVLGVIVLARDGLAQFSDDDLRLLEIYAGLAAEAIAHAEATEQLRDQSAALERQLRSQRALLSITESILTTLDPSAVLEQIAERLGVLIGYDNLSIQVVDPGSGALTPLSARGVHADQYLQPWTAGERGIATWVLERNEPALLLDERNDPRVSVFRGDPMDGSMIVVPLRGRTGATGVLTLERLGIGALYTEEEFELVKLFAAQVSIALQNAEVHRAVEIRARSDDLTGLLNHGTFRQWLQDGTERGEPFCLVMIDLDDFKAINDAFGHQAGDRLLRQIGAAIVAAGRENDLVFRYGGDEFAVLAPGTDLAGRDADRPACARCRSRAAPARRRTASRRARDHRIDRRRGLPGRRDDRRGDPPRRGSGVLPRKADRPKPDCQRGRRAGGRRGVLAPGADTGRSADTARLTERLIAPTRAAEARRSRKIGPSPQIRPTRQTGIMQPRAPRARRSSAVAISFLLVALIVGACSPGPVGTLPPPSSEPSSPRQPPSRRARPPPSTAIAGSPSPSGSPSFVLPTPTPEPTLLTYIVVAGDSLLSIAARYKTSGRSIAFWNRAEYPTLDPDSAGYKPNHLEIGWKLNLIPGVTLDDQGPLPTPRPSPFPSVSVPPPPSAAADGSSVVISNGSRSTHLVALTFDIGGEIPPTLDVLNWLIANDVRATVFATGSAITTPGPGQQAIALVSAHPDLFSIGNLTWDYPSLTGLDAPGITDELARTDGAIFAATGRSSKPFFRPPYGAQDAPVRLAAGKAGYTYTIMWDVDTVDWKSTADGGPTADDIVAKVLSRAQGGSIILMHLGGFNTLAALPRIVAGLQANGLTPVTLDELLGLP